MIEDRPPEERVGALRALLLVLVLVGFVLLADRAVAALGGFGS